MNPEFLNHFFVVIKRSVPGQWVKHRSLISFISVKICVVFFNIARAEFL